MTAAVLPHRFATDALPATFSAATRMEFVRDGYAQLAMAIDLEPLCGEHQFRLDLTTFQLTPNAGLGGGTLSPYVARRSRALAARAGTDAVLATRFTQPFRFSGGPLAQAEFAPGDTLLAPMDEAFEYVYPAAGAIQTIWVQRAALRPLLPRLDGRARRFGACPRMDLLFGYAGAVRREAAFDAPLAGLAAAHLTDLLALALGAHGDAAEQARAGGERAARLSALRAEVAREYRDPQLSVAHVAQRHDDTLASFHSERSKPTRHAFDVRNGPGGNRGVWDPVSDRPQASRARGPIRPTVFRRRPRGMAVGRP